MKLLSCAAVAALIFAASPAFAWGDLGHEVIAKIELARRDAYALPDRPTCDDHRSLTLSSAYEAAAERDAAVQLEKAGVRLAYVLNGSQSVNL